MMKRSVVVSGNSRFVDPVATRCVTSRVERLAMVHANLPVWEKQAIGLGES
jgi:hypothetical protein